ncbi:hypothetical protein IFR05_009257 [Cadophora sp. M221]|nr:hypothetical protein IFR05_009257 [Cadophora sp. M221]
MGIFSSLKSYSPLPSSDDEHQYHHSNALCPHYHHQARSHKTFQIATALLSGMLLALVAFNISPPSFTIGTYIHTNTLGPAPDSASDINFEEEGIFCGNSSQEALAMGCRYDVIAATWSPPQCHDQDLLDEMLSQGSWTWFTDKEHTQEVSQDVAVAGDFWILYPLYDFHVAHCLHLWRKLHKAVLNKSGIDDDLWKYGHTDHCVNLIMNYTRDRPTVTMTHPYV